MNRQEASQGTIFVNYAFLDMNSYFASVAQQEEAALRNKPVGIVTIERPGAACIAASYEAKACGIGVGTRSEEARELCPGIIFRPARHDLYVEYHHRIRDAIERVHPIDKAHSVDEFAMRLSGTARHLSEAIKIAKSMRQSIYDHAGDALHCSIGLGKSKLLAKMAGEMEKPNGLNWLGPEVMPEKLSGYPLNALPGIGRGMEKRLFDAGIHDIETLYTLSPKHARKLWNSVNGERFIMALHGHDIPDPKTHAHSLGHSQILSRSNRTHEGARLVAKRLLIKAATRVRRDNYVANTMLLSAKCKNKGKLRITSTMAATCNTFIFLKNFARLWPKLEIERPVSVSVMLCGLTSASQQTADLFEQSNSSGDITNQEKLCTSIDTINQRFGRDTVMYGEQPRELTPFTGTKIAFGRIPGRDEFKD